ncbi:tellurite resistance TerB family protein [Fodinicurvata sediminis]|uniref:tellurite resistance TerB family protein n=1 Tax=Fodinicurvata sediminis TaxID=1121832 RepID=UPI0003B5F6AE|nr:tellurite resistance TerB family protein [Fodinicurvata sediminis]
MNVSSILNQLVQQASGQSSGQAAGQGAGPGTGQGGSQGRGQGGGKSLDIGGMVNSLSSQLKGRQGSSGGIDVKSLLGGGALGLMVGSKRGRHLGGKVLKYGALAGIGVLAWKAYQNYQGNKGQDQPQPQAGGQEGQPLEQLQGQAQEERGLEILQAMIMAARADGHVNADERAIITQEIEKLGPDDELHAWIEQQFDAPLDAAALAAKADSPQAAREIYLVSAVIIDDQNPMERAWLEQLSAALQLPADMTRELDRQVQELSQAG